MRIDSNGFLLTSCASPVVRVAITLALASAFVACKAGSSEKKTNSSVKSTQAEGQLVLSQFNPSETHGAGYDLGIAFAPVESSVVQAFTKAHTASDATIANQILKMGSATGNGVWESGGRSDPLASNSFGLLKAPVEDKKANLAKALQPLLKAYFEQTSKWLALKCFDIEINSSKSLVAVGYHKLEKHKGALTCSFLNHLGKDALATVFTDGMAFGFGADRLIDAKDAHQTHWEFAGEGTQKYFTVGVYEQQGAAPVVAIQTNPEVTVGGKTVPGPSVTLLVVGDFLVPLYTWSISKITPVPVMKISSNGGAFAPGPIYDYGLIALKSLDDNAHLVSVMGKADAEQWNAGRHASVGNLARHFPAQYGKTLTYLERVGIQKSLAEKGTIESSGSGATTALDHLWPKTERIEVGALHMTIDAKYAAGSHIDARNVVVVGKPVWQGIIESYLAKDGTPATVHVNTLDTISFRPVASRDEVRRQLQDISSLCGSNWGSVPATTPGLAPETEIVLGGEWPEKLVGGIKATQAQGPSTRLTMCSASAGGSGPL